MTQILLIDLSSIAHPLWHVSGSDPDPNAVSVKTVERVRALASGQPHVAVCCDSGKSFRKDVDPTYKANRPESDAALQHQITLAMETLRGDGFPVWAVKGFEADDLIATACFHATMANNRSVESAGFVESVLIASSDKDLCALVGPLIHVKSLTNGTLYDTDGVLAKFGVRPDQMVDYLALVGDASDNIKGAKGIGPKGAASLLGKYGTLEDLYADLTAHGTNFTPSVATSLREFEPRMAVTRELITMRTDAPIAFEEVFRERVPSDVAVFGEDEPMEQAIIDMQEAQARLAQAGSSIPPQTQVMPPPAQDAQRPSGAATDDRKPAAATVENRGTQSSNAGSSPAPLAAGGDARSVTASRPDQPQAALSHGPVTYTPPQALQRQPVVMDFQVEDGPKTYDQAKSMAIDLYAARLFQGYGNAAAVLSTIIIGRELGLSIGASLRGFHIIESKHAMTADLIRARAIASPVCEYFRCTERTPERATFVTKRKGDPEPISLTYTVEDGRLAFGRDESTPAAKLAADKAWKGSGWGKNPADMCVARASSKLARLVYPDVVHGFYAPEELD